MNDLTVSIVIYNNYEDTEKAVASIEDYTNRSIQKTVFLVDNSVRPDIDAEKTAFRQHMMAYDSVEYIDVGKNIGFGKGHNYVLSRLDSSFHAIVNPDIYFAEDVFSDLMDFMDCSSIGMCTPRLVDPDGCLQPAYRREITVLDILNRTVLKRALKKREHYHTMQEQNFEEPFYVPFAQGSFLLVRTELFRRIGGFDERFFMYLEDADLCKRINQISQTWYCPSVTVYHKWGMESHKDRKLALIHLKSMILYFMKWCLKTENKE